MHEMNRVASGSVGEKASGPEKRLAIALSITLVILVVEVIGGIVSNSLALLSDAGHVLTDAFALGLSLIAVAISRRPHDDKATYGYHRFGLVVAIINGLSLVGIAAYIFYESYHRFVSPPEIGLAVMMPVAVMGFIANLIMVAILGRGGHHDLNIKSAWLHVMGDTLASLGVIVSGTIIYFTGWAYADPLAGVLIGLVIITGGTRVVRDALHVMLDLVPKGYDVEAIASEIEALDGVKGVHHVHIRSLTHGRVSFSAHVWVTDQMLSELEKLRLTIEAELKRKGIGHIILQFETVQGRSEGVSCETCGDEEDRQAHGYNKERYEHLH